MLKEKGKEPKQSSDKEKMFNSTKNRKKGIPISRKLYLTL